MLDRTLDKYTNVNYYLVGAWNMDNICKDIDEHQLLRVIEGCKRLLKRPYLRFMYVSRPEAVCFVMDNGQHITRLVTLSQVEEMLADGNFDRYSSASRQ